MGPCGNVAKAPAELLNYEWADVLPTVTDQENLENEAKEGTDGKGGQKLPSTLANDMFLRHHLVVDPVAPRMCLDFANTNGTSRPDTAASTFSLLDSGNSLGMTDLFDASVGGNFDQQADLTGNLGLSLAFMSVDDRKNDDVVTQLIREEVCVKMFQYQLKERQL